MLERAGSGLDVEIVDVTDQEFYDIQPLRRGHVARAKLASVILAGAVAGAESEKRFQPIAAEVVTHLVAHRSGFVVIRPTIRLDRLNDVGGVDVDWLHRLQQAAWVEGAELSWRVPGVSTPLTGGARHYMNWVFLKLYAAWSGVRSDAEELAVAAVETTAGCGRLHEMFAAGDLEYPFPVSFGTELQLVVPRSGDTGPQAWCRRAAELARTVMRPDPAAAATLPSDAEHDASTVCWFVDNNCSLVVRADGDLDETLDVVDAERVQLIEFLTLRRAALASVQRATQRVLTERLTVSQRQVARWQYLVATTTDDYVLDARVAHLLELLNRHFATDPRLRDVRDLERQVRANLDWFQARMEAAAGWTGGLVGAAVGAAALALSLTEVVRLVIASATGTPVAEVADTHTGLLAAALAVLVAISFALALAFVRRMATTLRPKSHSRRFTWRTAWRRVTRRLRRRPVPSRSPEPEERSAAVPAPEAGSVEPDSETA